MGWIFTAAFAALSFVALYLSGKCSRLALELSGAILLVGVAGYGWQGSPDMPGHPVANLAVTNVAR